MTSPNILTVEAKSDYRLAIRWADGSETVHDLSSVVAERDWALPLRDPAVFSRVAVEENGREVIWRGTDIEFSADGLWEDIHPPAVPPPPWMSGDEFRGWMLEMNLTWDSAAEALAVSRRTIGNYLSGDMEIPKTVWLACMHLAAERRRKRGTPSGKSRQAKRSAS